MRRILNQVFGAGLIVFALCVLGLGVHAQSYGGRSTGVSATVNNGTSTGYVFADTGTLPVQGGNITISAPSASIPGVLGTGVLTASTSGALKSSQSVTIANDLDILIGGVRIRANRVTANSGCICCPGLGDGSCGGSSVLNGLTVTDQAGAVTNVSVSGQANQVVSLPNGIGTLTLNQQTGSGPALTVTGLRVDAAANGVTYTILVATSSSNIECVTLTPSAAKITISGRVLDSTGRPISRVTVVLTDSNGNARSTSSNTFGNYSFTDVEAGDTYILQVIHRSYSFQSQVVNAEDDVTIDLIAN